ncbi:hypothetical protein HRbin12_01716 [bacterium HR12]|nr:hypothetical protein HRbin12_01716 [bacterium HR12]
MIPLLAPVAPGGGAGTSGSVPWALVANAVWSPKGAGYADVAP